MQVPRKPAPWLLTLPLAAAAIACSTPGAVVQESVVAQATPTFAGQQAQVEEAGIQIAEISVPEEGFDHIPEGTSGEYSHYPPSSGQHYPSPVPWGAYSDALPPEVWIHNLEHSGIAVLYNCPDGCPELVADLIDWATNAAASKWGHQKILIFPNDQIDTQIVALAWGWQLDLDEFDAGQLTTFYERHLDQGPENVP